MKSPIINSPYTEPTRHFKADERAISDEVLVFRRPSTGYVSAMLRTSAATRQTATTFTLDAMDGDLYLKGTQVVPTPTP